MGVNNSIVHFPFSGLQTHSFGLYWLIRGLMSLLLEFTKYMTVRSVGKPEEEKHWGHLCGSSVYAQGKE